MLSPTQFVSPRLGFRPILDPLPVAAFADVCFQTSLMSDGSDAMYALDPSIFLGFTVGD